MAEVLQGAGTESHFDELSSLLSPLRYLHANETHWHKAARLSFELMRRGQITPLSDLLIAVVALEAGIAVFATDPDFQRVPNLKLHQA
jgi:predicted nucleic acid-binding protein